jgi:hypothetical protein
VLEQAKHFKGRVLNEQLLGLGNALFHIPIDAPFELGRRYEISGNR